MLICSDWALDHLRNASGQRGNSAAGRAFINRARSEQICFTFRCDSCDFEATYSFATAKDVNYIRYWIKKALNQEALIGKHLCRHCAEPFNKPARLACRATPEYKLKMAQRSHQDSWQALNPNKHQATVEKARRTRNETLAAKSPEERSLGVRKQWASLSEEAKLARSAKISATGKDIWASLSDDARNARVRNMVKAMPRSAVSDVFREALIRENLYTGFESEVAVSGFVADECNGSLHLILEFFGDYYHCNPRKYAGDFYNTTLHMTAADRWQYDRRRLAAFRKAGFTPLVIWECDWAKDPQGVLLKVRTFMELNNACNSD